MGCCLSAGGRNLEAEHGGSIYGEPPTSPPVTLEVEAVKEMLLETPVAPKSEEKIKATPPPNQELKGPAAETNGKYGGVEDVPEVTEISEVCSNYSESLSTAAEKGGGNVDDGVVDQRSPPRKRRASGVGRGRGARVVARRLPDKRGPVLGRAVAAQPLNAAEENVSVKRKDLVEGSKRRSRSPVRREDAAPPQNENDRKNAAPPKGGVLAEEAETLENPVVSLECFIFL